MTRRDSTREPWYLKMLADRAEQLAKNVARMKRESPYRAARDCSHMVCVERTCDVQPNLAEAHFVIRARAFECGDCGVGVWPESDEAAERRPRCIAPFCNCLEPSA